MQPVTTFLSLVMTLSPVLALRWAALSDTGVQLSGVVLRGLTSDIASALLALALIQGWMHIPARGHLKKLCIGCAAITLSAWVIICYGNYEHILANDANLAITNAKYLKSKTFLSGSILHISSPILACLCVIVSLSCFVLLNRRPKLTFFWAPYAAPLLLLTLLWPVQRDQLTWLQEHPIQALFSPAEDDELTASTKRDAEISERLAPDLSGTPRFPFFSGEKRPNVLLIMLEGGTGANIVPFAKHHKATIPEVMPLMSKVAQEHFGAATFISHQRQTDRGEYALLCGDYPKLNRLPPRMTDIATAQASHRCLPQFLSDHGYQTAYLQPAPMSFMMKDRFMKKIGFQISKGADFFSKGYKRGGWGIDDRAFFEQSFKVFKELEDKGKPWMAALMTVGTHHPLIVPSTFKKKSGESKMSHALRYTDKYLKALLDQMDRAGMLDHTVVLITSDESRGFKKIGGVTRTLSQNWSFLVSLLPTGQPTMVTEPYNQSDIALSVIDYVGLGAKKHDFIGRSLFRAYDQPRAQPMSNIFFHKSYLLTPDRKLAICSEDLRKCNYYQRKDERIFGPGWKKISKQNQLKYELGRYVNWSTANHQEQGSFRPLMSMVTLDRGLVELTQAVRKRQWVFGGQFLSAPAGKKAFVELDFEIDGEPHALVNVTSRLDLEHKYKHKLPPARALKVGDRYQMSYTFTREGPIRQLEHILWAWRLNSARARIIVHKAEIRFEDLEADADEDAGLEQVELKLTRRSGGRWKTIEPATHVTSSIHQSDQFRINRCLKRSLRGDLIADRCPKGYLILGPHQSATADSALSAHFVLKGIEGSGAFSASLYDVDARKLLGRTDTLSLEEGEEITLHIEGATAKTLHSVEARLQMKRKPRKGSFTFQVLEGTLKISPDQAEAKPSEDQNSEQPVKTRSRKESPKSQKTGKTKRSGSNRKKGSRSSLKRSIKGASPLRSPKKLPAFKLPKQIKKKSKSRISNRPSRSSKTRRGAKNKTQ